MKKESNLKLERSLVVFDLETTAKEAYKAEIVEFAGIKINPDGTEETLEFLCKPKNPIPKEASDIHGITNEQVADFKPFKNYAWLVLEFFEDADVAGFNNNRYDNKVLERELADCGHPDFFKDRTVYDAYPIFCKHASRKLVDAVKFYTGKDASDAHEAMGDVRSTVEVIKGQLEREKLSFAEVAAKSMEESKEREARASDNPMEKYIVFDDKKRPVVNFTKKYKGQLLQDMDSGFLSWMRSQPFIPKEVKDFLKDFKKNKS